MSWILPANWLGYRYLGGEGDPSGALSHLAFVCAFSESKGVNATAE